MKGSSQIRSVFAALGLAIALTFTGAGQQCRAESKPVRPGLGDHLKRLGYDAIALEPTKDNGWAVRGFFNGKKRVLLVDTGCSVTTLTKEAADGMRPLSELGAKLEDRVLGGLDDPSTVVIDKLTLGRIEFVRQPALARRLVFASGAPLGCDGLLGSDFLMRHYCLLDLLEGRLYVRASEPPTDTVGVMEATFQKSHFAEVPLRVNRSLLMTCEAVINGHALRLLVDSGAAASVLDNDLVTPLALRLYETPQVLTGLAQGTLKRIRYARLRTLELGDLHQTNVECGVSELSGWGIAEARQPLGELGGLLGGYSLMWNGAIIDCHRHKLWLMPQRLKNKTGT